LLEEEVTVKDVQSLLLLRIERKLGEINRRLEAVEARGIPFNPAKIYQYKTVEAGKYGVVYEYDPRPYVAFIQYVGCKWFPKTYYLWEIDRTSKEKVERTIGNADNPTSEPLRLKVPLVANERIRWTAYNGDSADHVFEVLNDGLLYTQSVAKYMGGAELNSGFKR
jgi:hypothetical protein